MDTLNPKQSRFVEEYCVDFNATKSAHRAGYSPRSGSVHAARLLANAKVAAAIKERMALLSERSAIDATWLTQKAVEVVERCLEENFNPQGAVAALNLLAKRFPEFSLKADITITREGRISAVMDALGVDRDEAEHAIAEAEQIVAQRR